MNKTLTKFLEEDHTRLQNLFQEYLSCEENELDLALGYLLEFYAGSMRYLAWEDRVLLPALRERENGDFDTEAFCKRMNRLGDTLRELRRCLQEGSPLPPDLEEKVADRFSSHRDLLKKEVFPVLKEHLDETFQDLLYNGLRKINKEQFFGCVPSTWFYSSNGDTTDHPSE